MPETLPVPEPQARRDTLNTAQRRAVECGRNAVVAAGAGSGKTSVLASRYVRLITQGGLRVDQILSLTFTRKAAAQMYQRIHGALSAQARDAGTGAGEAARLALKDFFHAHIQTLDSYCVYLVKQGAARYGIRPDFTVDDEGARELALRESLPFLISRVNHPALGQLYREKRPQDIARDMFAASVLAHGHIDQTPAYARGAAAQFSLIRVEWKKAREALLPLLDELAALCAEDPRDNFLVQLRGPLEQYRRVRDASITDAGMGEYFDSLLDSGGLSTDHPLRKEIIQWLYTLHSITYARANIGKRNSRAKAIVTSLRQIFPLVSSILVYTFQGGLILSLLILLDEFQRIYVEKKRAQGILTFSDVARLARTILRDQKDIRNNEKAAFRAIMIDEFQDNNALQKELLYLLAEKHTCRVDGIPSAADLEEGKLFFVGDEKQSIYRFRGADVSVFRELKTELAAEDLNLGVNYRSSPELIALFNAVFGGSLCDPTGSSPLFRYASVFPPAAAALPPYEADYSPLSAGIDKGGAAAVYILDSSRKNAGDSAEDDIGDDAPTGGDTPTGGDGEQLKNDENEAAFIAAKIRELLEEHDEKDLPRFRPDDIAILFRTRSPQRFFEKHLRLLQIPYAAEGLSGFFADGPVNDMAAFLRLIAYPLDTEAYAVFLRSPFAGLSIEGLAACIACLNGERSRGPATGDQPFAEIPPLTDEGDRRAWERGRELYLRIREKAAGLSIGQVLNELWYGEGYRYETIWNPRTRAHRELFDYLYSQALRADEQGLSVAAFSDRLETLRERDNPLEDTEIPLERSGAVRLLTVHKSKGLEFKVVFVVCCGKRGGTRNGGAGNGGTGNGQDLYASSDNQISFNPPLPPECADLDRLKRNFFYERDRLEERRRETAELRRLLYVAMTRARERLFLSGSFPLDLGDGDPLKSLAAALEKKIAAKDSDDVKRGSPALEGDRILDNNTFFGLLLPALAEPRGPGPSVGPPAQPESWPSCLHLGLIPALTVEDLRDRERWEPRYPNTRSGLGRFLNDSAVLYAGARVLHSPVLEPDHLNASAAGDLVTTWFTSPFPQPGQAEFWRHDPALSGEPAADIFGRVDPILSKDRSERSFAEFGTLAHLCVEEQLSSAEPGEIRIPPGLAGNLSPAETRTLLEAGARIAGRFLASPLGQEARAAPFRRSEYPFRCLWDSPPRQGMLQGGGGVFINGIIDLLYERDNEVRVVDFKTDNSENPEEHLAQMTIYRRAARELLGKPCRVWLYYLRTGRAVEIDLTR
ncbi:MAG: UvrD-helicase domain-containing protein [Treponema sp.]|jgi:ATP-dependent helicase/nuclease subunit A|nr:UvrD-helicase domain-containing protein [Treponema sp.]